MNHTPHFTVGFYELHHRLSSVMNRWFSLWIPPRAWSLSIPSIILTGRHIHILLHTVLIACTAPPKQTQFDFPVVYQVQWVETQRTEAKVLVVINVNHSSENEWRKVEFFKRCFKYFFVSLRILNYARTVSSILYLWSFDWNLMGNVQKVQHHQTVFIE
jgi:hypothetical protein